MVCTQNCTLVLLQMVRRTASASAVRAAAATAAAAAATAVAHGSKPDENHGRYIFTNGSSTSTAALAMFNRLYLLH